MYAAQKPSPEQYPDFKEGSIPQPGNDLTHTHVCLKFTKTNGLCE